MSAVLERPPLYAVQNESSPKHIIIDGARVEYFERGQVGSPTITLNHGQLDESILTFGKVIDEFAAEGFHVLAINRPGHGKSDPDKKYGIQASSELLKKFKDKKGIRQSHDIGISWGASIVLEHALQYPERVKTVTSVSGYMSGEHVDLSVVDNLRLPEPLKRVGKMATKILIRSPFAPQAAFGFLRLTERAGIAPHVLTYVLNRFVTHNSEQATENLSDIWDSVSNPNTLKAFIYSLRAESREHGDRGDLLSRLGDIKVPSHFMQGVNDRIVSLKRVVEAQSLIPGSHLTAFNATGHWIPVENPEKFVRRQVQFINDQTRRPLTLQESPA